LTFTIDTPVTDVDSICSATGTLEKLILSRTAVMDAVIVLEPHEVGLFDKFINSATTQLMANFGPKDGSGNWVPGKCVNIYFANAAITSHVISDNNGYLVINLSAKAFVTSTREDVYLNFV
jgi:hypothetical protein